MTQLCFNAFNRSAWFEVDPLLPEQIRAAGAAGFPLFGPDVFSHHDARRTRAAPSSSSPTCCEASGVRCYEIAALMVGTDDAEAQAEQIAAYASVLRPEWVLTNVMAPVDDGVRDEFVRCAAVFAARGARLAVEYLPWTPVASAAVAFDLVASVPATGAGCSRTCGTTSAAPTPGPSSTRCRSTTIAYVQFSDALPMTSDDIVDETVSRRVFPGEGEFDLDTYCEHMRAKGFDGVVSVEVLSAAMRDMDPCTSSRGEHSPRPVATGVDDPIASELRARWPRRPARGTCGSPTP